MGAVVVGGGVGVGLEDVGVGDAVGDGVAVGVGVGVAVGAGVGEGAGVTVIVMTFESAGLDVASPVQFTLNCQVPGPELKPKSR